VTQDRSAAVVDDLECVQCGYLLRTLNDTHSCPECGTPVRSSQKFVERPELLARAATTIGWSYAAVFSLVIVTAAPLFFILAAFAGACARGAAVLLLWRAGLASVPVISRHVDTFAIMIAVELFSIALLVVWLVLFQQPQRLDHQFAWFGWAWLMVASASMLPATWIVGRLARQLGHEAVVLQLRTARRCMIAAAALGILAFIAISMLMAIHARIVWVGLIVHGLIAMLGAGHAMVSFTTLARRLNPARASAE
jgi:hypothetical protein